MAASRHEIGPMTHWVPPGTISQELNKLPGVRPGPYPAKFDLRTQGRVTPARLSDCASCWSVAATGALEASLLRPGSLETFSEDHMQVAENDCGTGGHELLAAGYYASWNGPVAAGDFDVHTPDAHPPIPPKRHVQTILFPPPRKHALDNDGIKFHLVHHGGIYASASWRGLTAPQENAYYWPQKSPAHAVVLVGWDDDFAGERFTYTYQSKDGPVTLTPPGNGAFIAKNNSGPDFGEQGFFFISYHDGTLGYAGMAIYLPEPVDNFAIIHQHEQRGMLNLISGSLLKGANVFQAITREELRAIAFFASDPGYEYTVELHLQPNDGPVNSSGPACTVRRYVDCAGYYTVRLPHPIVLSPGQRFSVVLSGAAAGHANWSAPLACDYVWTDQANTGLKPGRSYIRTDGTAWSDLANIPPTQAGQGHNGYLCIKAFATPRPKKDSLPMKNIFTPLWKMIQTLLNTLFGGLQVIATTPANGENIPYPSLSVLTVTFSKPVTQGEAFYAIQVFSDTEVKGVFCSVNGTQLTMQCATPLAPHGLGGTQWTAVLPNRALVDASGNGLPGEYRWSFTTIGVN